MFKIGDFSKLTMISIRMLRHYDEIGLLIPKHIDQWTGYRYYDVSQLVEAGRIQQLKQLGLGLAQIKAMLPEYDSPERFKAGLKAWRTQLDEQLDTLQTRRTQLDYLIHRIETEEPTMYDVKLQTFAPMHVVALRRTIPRYEREDLLWKQYHSELAEYGISVQPAIPSFCASIYYDEGFKEEDVDVEIRLAISGDCPNLGSLRTFDVPEITAATALVRGDFSQISSACNEIGCWIDENGCKMCGPMFIIYHVSPQDAASPEDYLISICFPVEKK